jgi:hypothetical protein
VRALSWQERIEAARSEREIVDVVRDYLAANHYAFARLSEDCKPTRMVCASDISQCTLALVRRQVEAADPNDDFLHRAVAFFILANSHLNGVLAIANDDEDALKDSA